jgi:proliferating cell nuclear antigen
MFKAKIKTDKLNEVIGAVSTMVMEAKVRIGPDGLSIKAVDAANVAMVFLNLESGAFESFDATKGELGLDIHKVRNIIDMTQKDSETELELDELNQKLIIKMAGGLRYTTSLLPISSLKNEPKIGSIDYPVHVVMRGDELWRAVKAAESINDYLYLGTTPEGGFYVEAEDVDKIRYDCAEDQLIQSVHIETRTMFSAEYISDICKFAGKKEEVALDIKTDYPLTIGFKIADGHGTVSYMIAPRVESA